VLDVLVSQNGEPPFNPRHAVTKFAGEMQNYRVSKVYGDAYGGQTHRLDFQSYGITYEIAGHTKHQLYEALEPRLNAGEVQLLDHPSLQEQLLTLVYRGGKVDHLPGDHDDYANAAAGAVWLAFRMATRPLIYGLGGGIISPTGYLPQSNPNLSGPVSISGRSPG
jgi:hypothetical protein